MSDIQVKLGTMISPLTFNIFKHNKDKKFAEEPELTKTLYFTPNHLDQFFQIL